VLLIRALPHGKDKALCFGFFLLVELLPEADKRNSMQAPYSTNHEQLLSAYLYGEIDLLKHELISNYMMYLKKLSIYDAKSMNMRVSQDDLLQNYLIAMQKAINHFNLNSGAFKSYLDIWVKKIRNSPISNKINAVTLEDKEGLKNTVQIKNINSVNEEQELRKLINLADRINPQGYLTQYLNLSGEDNL